MTRRRKHRGERRPGLFEFTPAGITTEPTTGDNPRKRPCRFCGAPIGEPCTRPAGRGKRVEMRGTYHDSRTTTQHQENT